MKIEKPKFILQPLVENAVFLKTRTMNIKNHGKS